MRAILNVLPSNGNVEKGEILYCGEDVLKMSNAKLQEYRQKRRGHDLSGSIQRAESGNIHKEPVFRGLEIRPQG
ncbi:MAG: hypothetical protein ACLTLQ_18900 [[Clostridium] scindens]